MKNITFSKSENVTLEKINYLAKENISEFVLGCEKYYDNQLNEVINRIMGCEYCKIILLAGPSGSGKTTTANKLTEKLKEKGKNALFISLDDFFLNREDLPILENGETDFESVNTLDISEIRKCFGLLLSGKKANIPYFDFKSGKRDNSKSREICIGENDIIIVEGLHAINPQLTDGIDAFDGKGFFKLFVNPGMQIFNEKGEIVLRKRQIRLIRRMIRDYLFRGSSVENTLNMWEGVNREEMKSIIPFMPTADYVVNTIHYYEPCIYHHYLLPILKESKVTDDKHKKTVSELVKSLDLFYEAELSVVPHNSMIREFIGEPRL